MMILAVTGVITASEPSWIAPFTGLSPSHFAKLVTALRREGADPVRKGRPWSLTLEDRVLLVAAYWRTDLNCANSPRSSESRSHPRTGSSTISAHILHSNPASGSARTPF